MKNIITYILLALIITSCGTSNIIVSNNDAEIFINGANEGKGRAKVTRAGPPKRINIDVKYQGRVVASTTEKRRFDIVTAIVGFYSYGFGFVFCWRYPKDIYVQIDDSKINPPANTKSNSNQGIWMNPDKGIWNR